jgi:hypothetical protein
MHIYLHYLHLPLLLFYTGTPSPFFDDGAGSSAQMVSEGLTDEY